MHYEKMEKKSNEVLFETSLTWLDYLLSFVLLMFGAIGFFYLAIKMTKSEWGAHVFICLFFLILIIQTVRGAKTFHLLGDRFIVRRPLSFITNTDITFNLTELKEIIFRRIKGRFGGPHIIIKSKHINESYRIDFNEETLNKFKLILTQLGIKFSSENMD